MLVAKLAIGLLIGADFVFHRLPASVLAGSAHCPTEPGESTEGNGTPGSANAGPAGTQSDPGPAPSPEPARWDSELLWKLWEQWTEFLGPLLRVDPVLPAEMGWIRWRAYHLWYGVDTVVTWRRTEFLGPSLRVAGMGWLRCVAYHPTEYVLACGFDDGTLRVWACWYRICGVANMPSPRAPQ